MRFNTKNKNILEAEFDKFAEEYSELHQKNIHYSGESRNFFAEYKIKDTLNIINTPLENYKILDFGAGIGTSAPYFRIHFPGASLTCLDVSKNSLDIGKMRFSDIADFMLFDGKKIPFDNNSFDLVFAACVFHHIPDAAHIDLLREWHRILKPGGTAVIFEHNPFNPLTVHAVNTCPFDENAQLIRGSNLCKNMQIAGFKNVNLRYRLFFPGFLRKLRPLERWLNWCPLGAQYFVHTRKY